MSIVTTQEGDVLDALCYQQYGSSNHITDVLKQNPHLANYETHLPAGINIHFEEVVSSPVIVKTVKLWD